MVLTHVRVALIADTSKPTQLPPHEFGAVAGYIGGDTPHVWTPADWRKFPHDRKLPIFVRSTVVGAQGGLDDGFAALEALYELGVPKGSYVAYDRETNTDVQGTHAFNGVVHWGGFYPLPYGSKGNIFDHPAPYGYWVADYTGTPHMYPHSGVVMTQYTNGDAQGWDENEMKLWAFLERVKEWEPK